MNPCVCHAVISIRKKILCIAMDFPYGCACVCVATGQVKCLIACLCFWSVSSSITISSFQCARRAKPYQCVPTDDRMPFAIRHNKIYAITYISFFFWYEIHFKFTNYNLFLSIVVVVCRRIHSNPSFYRDDDEFCFAYECGKEKRAKKVSARALFMQHDVCACVFFGSVWKVSLVSISYTYINIYIVDGCNTASNGYKNVMIWGKEIYFVVLSFSQHNSTHTLTLSLSPPLSFWLFSVVF